MLQLLHVLMVWYAWLVGPANLWVAVVVKRLQSDTTFQLCVKPGSGGCVCESGGRVHGVGAAGDRNPSGLPHTLVHLLGVFFSWLQAARRGLAVVADSWLIAVLFSNGSCNRPIPVLRPTPKGNISLGSTTCCWACGHICDCCDRRCFSSLKHYMMSVM